jgi:hypothetical protein
MQAGENPAATSAPHAIAEAAALSPVFVIPLNRKELVEQYQRALTEDGIESPPLPDESPYLAVPKK